MRLSNKILALAAPAALLALSACATGLPTQVSRFQALPAPAGQTFIVQPADPRDRGGLEFTQYATLVAQHLAAQGYTPAMRAGDAALVVTLDYGVDGGQTRVVSRPGFSRWGWGGYGGFGYRPYYSRFGYFGRGHYPFYYGWNDPFWFDDYGRVDSYTVYTSYLDMDIKRAVDGQSLFEGTARARSRTDNLQSLVPNLVQAMFTGFPGNSGETVRITVPPPGRRG